MSFNPSDIGAVSLVDTRDDDETAAPRNTLYVEDIRCVSRVPTESLMWESASVDNVDKVSANFDKKSVLIPRSASESVTLRLRALAR